LPAVCALSSFIRLLLPYHFFSYNFWLVFLSGSSIPCFSLTRVNLTNVLDERLRIGEIGRRMNSKVKSVKQGV
jgi:hypothetical protein